MWSWERGGTPVTARIWGLSVGTLPALGAKQEGQVPHSPALPGRGHWGTSGCGEATGRVPTGHLEQVSSGHLRGHLRSPETGRGSRHRGPLGSRERGDFRLGWWEGRVFLKTMGPPCAFPQGTLPLAHRVIFEYASCPWCRRGSRARDAEGQFHARLGSP